jgi:hypothetical protein
MESVAAIKTLFLFLVDFSHDIDNSLYIIANLIYSGTSAFHPFKKGKTTKVISEILNQRFYLKTLYS